MIFTYLEDELLADFAAGRKYAPTAQTSRVITRATPSSTYLEVEKTSCIPKSKVVTMSQHII